MKGFAADLVKKRDARLCMPDVKDKDLKIYYLQHVLYVKKLPKRGKGVDTVRTVVLYRRLTATACLFPR